MNLPGKRKETIFFSVVGNFGMIRQGIRWGWRKRVLGKIDGIARHKGSSYVEI